MRLIPIDSTKNIYQFNTQIATNTLVVLAIAQGVNPSQIDETNPALSFYVEDGAMVKGFSIGMRIFNESGVADSASTGILLRKNEGSALGAPTIGQLNGLYAVPWKNKIFHCDQAITGSQVSGWPMGFPSIKIPRRFHTMKFNDKWELIIWNNTGNNLRACGMINYKWYK